MASLDDPLGGDGRANDVDGAGYQPGQALQASPCPLIASMDSGETEVSPFVASLDDPVARHIQVASMHWGSPMPCPSAPGTYCGRSVPSGRPSAAPVPDVPSFDGMSVVGSHNPLPVPHPHVDSLDMSRDAETLVAHSVLVASMDKDDGAATPYVASLDMTADKFPPADRDNLVASMDVDSGNPGPYVASLNMSRANVSPTLPHVVVASMDVDDGRLGPLVASLDSSQGLGPPVPPHILVGNRDFSDARPSPYMASLDMSCDTEPPVQPQVLVANMDSGDGPEPYVASLKMTADTEPGQPHIPVHVAGMDLLSLPVASPRPIIDSLDVSVVSALHARIPVASMDSGTPSVRTDSGIASTIRPDFSPARNPMPAGVTRVPLESLQRQPRAARRAASPNPYIASRDGMSGTTDLPDILLCVPPGGLPVP